MATKYVNPAATGSGDGSSEANGYTSMQAAITANAGTLSEPLELICSTTGATPADTTACTVSGITTSATNTLTIRAATGHRALATAYSTSRYRLEVASGGALTLAISNVFLYGLQVKSTDTGATAYGVGGTAALDNIIIDGLRINTSGASLGGIQNGTASTGLVRIVNCLVTGSGTSGYGIYWRNGGSAATRVTVSNCTVVGTFAQGFRHRNANGVWKNNISVGCTDAYLETTTAEHASYCAYDENGTALSGSNHIDISGETDDQTFVGTTADGDLRIETTSACYGAGANLTSDTYYAFTTDIEGTTRPAAGAWDLGAYEYPEAGGLSAFVAEQQRSTTF